MAALPCRDLAGNALVDVRFVTEDELADLDGQVAMPASLVVVSHAHAVLMMFDGWR